MITVLAKQLKNGRSAASCSGVEPVAEWQQIIVSVKSATVTPDMGRVLGRVVEREKAAMVLFVTLDEPTKEMTLETVTASSYHSKQTYQNFPKLQIVTIAQLFDGRTPKPPPLILPAYQNAAKARSKLADELKLGMSPER